MHCSFDSLHKCCCRSVPTVRVELQNSSWGPHQSSNRCLVLIKSWVHAVSHKHFTDYCSTARVCQAWTVSICRRQACTAHTCTAQTCSTLMGDMHCIQHFACGSWLAQILSYVLPICQYISAEPCRNARLGYSHIRLISWGHPVAACCVLLTIVIKPQFARPSCYKLAAYLTVISSQQLYPCCLSLYVYADWALECILAKACTVLVLMILAY